eukprot:6185780-Pleurochrysis_carterae.AAC.9
MACGSRLARLAASDSTSVLLDGFGKGKFSSSSALSASHFARAMLSRLQRNGSHRPRSIGNISTITSRTLWLNMPHASSSCDCATRSPPPLVRAPPSPSMPQGAPLAATPRFIHAKCAMSDGTAPPLPSSEPASPSPAPAPPPPQQTGAARAGTPRARDPSPTNARATTPSRAASARAGRQGWLRCDESAEALRVRAGCAGPRVLRCAVAAAGALRRSSAGAST